MERSLLPRPTRRNQRSHVSRKLKDTLTSLLNNKNPEIEK
jgi:hypothetical protein